MNTQQHAFITGGGTGIGLACARTLMADGVRVTLAGRREDVLRTAVAGLSGDGHAHHVVCDVSDESSVASAVAQADATAPLTIAVANAGTGGFGAILDTDDEDWHRIMQTNLTGVFYTFKHAGRALQKQGGGAMCAVSSIAGLRTHRFMAPYCVSKAGIDALVRNMADELGVHNIRVNSVCPGLVETDISVGLYQTPAIANDYLDCMPIRRNGRADDIGQAVGFLCGPQASWITGVVLPVDGGHHLRRGPNLDVFMEMTRS